MELPPTTRRQGGPAHPGTTFPNGIALSPDEKTLYVNVSDPEAPRGDGL